MSTKCYIGLLLLVASFWSSADAAATCFSLPSPPVDPAGIPEYSVLDCYAPASNFGAALTAMPAAGFQLGTSCRVPSACDSNGASLSFATCLSHPVTGEGYWSQPVCDISASKSFAASASTSSVELVASTEYATAIHLNDVAYTSVTSVQIAYNTAAPTAASNLVVRFYGLQDPAGESAGPGDLLYTAAGLIPDTPTSADTFSVKSDNGVQVVMSGDATAGTLTLMLPTPVNLGNDFFVSIELDTPASMQVSVGADNGAAQHYWKEDIVAGAFVSPTEVATSPFATIVTAVNVLSYDSDSAPCNPTLLTASIGYGQQQGGNGFDVNEPPMPYLDFTRSSILASSGMLELAFTYPTGVYDDIQFLPWNSTSAFGAMPLVVGTNNACGTTFQTVSVSQSGCQSTAKVHADFTKLIHQLNSGTNTQCGWVQSPNPVQYQGVYYTQWSGRIQVVTYQTVAVLGGTSVRAKAGYAWVVVRSPVVTSAATATQNVVDESVFKWSVVSQSLKTDEGIPFNSSTIITTQVTTGYELHAASWPAALVVSSSRTPWFFDSFNMVSASCPGSTPCVQSWQLSISQKDASVCSLDATVTIGLISRCSSGLALTGGCDASLERMFNITLFLSSVDFCKVVGGVTSLSVSTLGVSAPTSSQPDSLTAAQGLGANTPNPVALFAVGASIGVYMSVQSLPAVPITLSAVSARLYENNDRSKLTTYADVTSAATPFWFAQANTGSGSSSAFFNLPTGDNTVWLQQQTGSVHSVRVSVTATVTYDASSLGQLPEIVVFDLPLSAPTAAATPSSRSKLHVLANAIHEKRAIASAAVKSGSISADTQEFSIAGDGSAAPSSQMSTGAIAGAVIGSVAAAAVIVTAVVVVGKSVAVGAASAAAGAASAASASAGAGAATAASGAAASAGSAAAAASASAGSAASMAGAVVPAAVV